MIRAVGVADQRRLQAQALAYQVGFLQFQLKYRFKTMPAVVPVTLRRVIILISVEVLERFGNNVQFRIGMARLIKLIEQRTYPRIFPPHLADVHGIEKAV